MDTALTVFILICASMVLFMTPGVAFFYGGLSRKKNVGNTIIMVRVPYAEVVTYSRDLRSLTSGTGSFTLELNGYQQA